MSATADARRRIRAAAVQGVQASLLHLTGEAVRRAPVDEGTLRGTGHATDVEVHGETISGEVAFATVYAQRQHEELTWEHPKGGEAKYLEGPLKDNAQRYVDVIAANVARAIDG